MRNYKEKILLADLEELKKSNEAKVEVKEGSTEETKNGSDETDSKPKYTAGEDKVAFVKKFKGSVFVVFKSPELAKAAMEAITTYGGNQVSS